MYALKNIANKFSSNGRSGFTLVELLIVIVVIAVLAAIALVSYSGIQDRARISSAKSDLKSIGTAIQLYQAEESIYPRDRTELLNALSRQPAALEVGITNTGSFASDKPKSFNYCFSSDGSSMWVVAWKPVTGASTGAPDGKPVYYWSNGGLGETQYQFDGSQAGSSLCKLASQNSYSSSVWSYSTTIQTP